MTQEQLLAMVKLDLQLMTNVFDAYLIQLLTAAEQMITTEGITLTSSPQDDQLRIMYAAYLYRKRAENAPQMPRMLRWALNNRLFAQKGGGGGAA
ncbi:MAG: hypothetical protein HDT27_04935 [Subdoligranulum sp.]|nr:hypothetical protein [Subdoligranulum sp.]